MSIMNIKTAKINETVTAVRLDEKQLKALLTAAVAEAASIDLEGANVKVRRCFITSRNGPSGSEYEATIEIVEDHTPTPPAQPCDFLGGVEEDRP